MIINDKVIKANRLYCNRLYGVALRLYHELSSEFGHRLFFANIGLCLDKLSTNEKNIKANCIALTKMGKFDVLNELYKKNIIVSLTSYPARINAVSETIKSILTQSFIPSKIVLWLADEQFPMKEKDLPTELLSLKDKGLSIEWCEDIRSYKKLIPSLIRYANKIIVTADDDVIYDKNWLSQLVMTHIEFPNDIICHRAHKIVFDDSENFSSYKSWEKEFKSNHSSSEYLFTGVGGVLYPVGSLYQDTIDKNLFLNICPHGDDLWFWAMSVLQGTKIRIVKDSCFKIDFVPGTQDVALWIRNVQKNGNDVMLQALDKYYPEIKNKLQEKKFSTGNLEPLVSIIIPVYNTGKYLSKCLDSVINQYFTNFEVLCVDDGSTDELTLELLKKYSKADNRVRIIHQNNSGPASARNAGIIETKGEYIAFIDSDDYISENFIGNLYESAKLDDANISVCEQILCVNEENDYLEKNSGFGQSGETIKKHAVARAILTTGVSCNKLYKKEFLLRNELKYLDGMRCQAEDNYFSALAMIAAQNNIVMAKNSIYYYRQHECSITKNITKESFNKSVIVYENITHKLSKLDIADKKFWFNIIRQRALKDLRYISKSLADKEGIDDLLDSKFSLNIDICCIADENYIVPTMVFLESIKRSKRKTTQSSISILIPKGSKEKMEKLEKLSNHDFSVKVLEIDATQFENLHKYNENGNFCMASPSAMFKFIIPNVFPHLDRILYIDTDLIVRKDLQELFMTTMESEYLCAVPDLWTPVANREEIKKFNFYFNSGVMLMNLSKMRNDELPIKLIEAKINSTNYNLMDQDVFNEVCNGYCKILDIKYNFLPVCYKRHMHRFNIESINKLYRSEYVKVEEIAADPVVAHWAGSDKPWVSTSTLFSDEWMHIYKLLKKNGYISQVDFAVSGCN